jgi:uncharacterized integral membrane protein
MGKVRLIVGILIIVLLFVFALLNSGKEHTTSIQFFLAKWTLDEVPVWGIIFITLAVGLLVGYILRGGHKKKKEQT